MLVPLTTTASSSSTSSSSIEPKKELQKEQRVERADMIAPQEIQVMPADIKRANDDQGQGKADLMENLEQVQDDQVSVPPEPQWVGEE